MIVNSNSNSKCLVLVAAYNGATTLVEQLDSILRQEKIDVNIVISLDLSCDSSLDICTMYANKFSNITLLPYGERFGGAGKNFYRLLKDVYIGEYDIISFSDQDDIWPSDKIYRATQYLSEYDCYSSNVIAFWEDGREVLINKAQPFRRWDFLFEAAGPGCTYVFNRDFAINFQKWLIGNYARVSNNIELHDWLIYAFSRRYGYRWFIDAMPMMRYRQHANNQVGTNNNFKAAKKRISLIKSKWYRKQVMNIAECLDLQSSAIFRFGLENGYKGNLYLLVRVNELRRRARDRLALALFLLFNIF
ncbi:glycosyltransferase [Aeromonas caviae]|uniref:glycosyltransferase n=1 Tax=Aeromonas caviae TaxID=648 RepID=UPI0025B6B81E|nr:glycosyltransferase [Aeromonas caviae]